jgi:FMN phosphatase YigB (HAD superfamily)
MSEEYNVSLEAIRRELAAVSTDFEAVGNYDRMQWFDAILTNLHVNFKQVEVEKYVNDFYSMIESPKYDPAVESVLVSIKKLNKKLGLLTDSDYKPGTKMKRISKLPFARLFDKIEVAGDTIPYKKRTESPFVIIAKDLGVAPDKTIYIGDRMDFDIKNSKKAGMKAALITTYNDTRGLEDVVEPDWVVSNIREVLNIIK